MISPKSIQKELKEKKWKPIKKHPKFDSIIEFDIIDEKKSWYLADWFLFIKEVEKLDGATAEKLSLAMESLEEQERNWWQAKILFFIILAEEVDPEAALSIASDELDIRSINKKGEVSGRTIVIDTSKGLVYGSLPSSPLDSRLKLSHAKDSLEKVMKKPLHYVQPGKPKKLKRFWLRFFLLVSTFFLLGFISAFVFLLFLLRS
ncbi:hypothetical protein JXB28_02315 [Candidatus Woesearchaeota archaeon]|nr:hypothetical protein [Candidatus Woesearchaeota archaeon]